MNLRLFFESKIQFYYKDFIISIKLKYINLKLIWFYINKKINQSKIFPFITNMFQFNVKLNHISDKLNHISDKLNHISDKLKHIIDKLKHIIDKLNHINHKLKEFYLIIFQFTLKLGNVLLNGYISNIIQELINQNGSFS